jgi:nucleoid DNA-binding protein
VVVSYCICLSTIIDVISEELAKGGNVRLVGFGTFKNTKPPFLMGLAVF